MEFIKTYKNNYHPTVFLFSDPNSFSLYLLENLLSNLCNVVIFSDHIDLWNKSIEHITKTNRLVVDQKKNINNYHNPDYFLLLDLSDSSTVFSIKNIVNLPERLKAKGLIILKEGYLKTNEVNLPDSVGVILVDNLFGPRMEIVQENRICQILMSASNNKKIKILKTEKIAILYMKDAAKTIVKWLFSFGHYGEVIILSSEGVNLIDFCLLINKVFPGFRYQVVEKDPEPPDFNKTNTYLLNEPDLRTIEETLIWIKNNMVDSKIYQKTNLNKPKLKILILSLLVLLTLPYAFVSLPGVFLYLSYKTIKNQNLNTAVFTIKSAYTLSLLSIGVSGVYSKIPALNNLYKPSSDISYVFKSLGAIGQTGIDLINNSQILSENIVGGGEYDLIKLSGEIHSDLNDIETKISFIEADVKNYSILKNIDNKFNLATTKKIISGLSQISSLIPDILGVGTPKTYLILFQNNMELRPTGGFIGSFALISLTSGKIDEIIVQDVYSADGQLKGHVEPPLPIKKYLKEANWFLRDSNWDPDFPSSAEKARWFLDKEIDVWVDGVISLDLEPIKDILSLTGPIYLNDYQVQISAENFYEKTQSEVENDFFPGSTKKSSFITALTREMLNILLAENQFNKIGMAEVLFNNLQARHIQVYLDNPTAKEVIKNIGWDGSVSLPTCSNNCYSDFTGLIEANLGVNKANYYIERESSLFVNIEQDLVTKTLTINYLNIANQALGNSGIYKVYARLLVPKGTVLDYIKVGENIVEKDTEILKDREEIGFYFEVFPEQTKKVTISWQNKTQLNFNQSGEYWLNLRKQAGIPEGSLTVVYNSPPGVDLRIEHGYNTLFTKDINSQVTWKK